MGKITLFLFVLSVLGTEVIAGNFGQIPAWHIRFFLALIISLSCCVLFSFGFGPPMFIFLHIYLDHAYLSLEGGTSIKVGTKRTGVISS